MMVGYVVEAARSTARTWGSVGKPNEANDLKSVFNCWIIYGEA